MIVFGRYEGRPGLRPEPRQGPGPWTPLLKKLVSKGIAFGDFQREGAPVAKGVWGGAPAFLI